jgi:hypothetical protein
MQFKNVSSNGSELLLEWNLEGPAVIVLWDEGKSGHGCVLSCNDARKMAAELIRLAEDIETYGTSINPIKVG